MSTPPTTTTKEKDCDDSQSDCWIEAQDQVSSQEAPQGCDQGRWHQQGVCQKNGVKFGLEIPEKEESPPTKFQRREVRQQRAKGLINNLKSGQQGRIVFF